MGEIRMQIVLNPNAVSDAERYQLSVIQDATGEWSVRKHDLTNARGLNAITEYHHSQIVWLLNQQEKEE